jgi:outer membrane protein OmpA-like peptidoglycan-associated protein
MQFRLALIGVLAVAGLTAASSANAQGLGDRLKKRASEAAKRTVEQRVDQKSTEATNAALDKAEGAVKCAASDKACQDKAKADGKKVVVDDSAPKGGAPVANSTEAKAASSDAGKGTKEEAAFVNFDFVPGERVLFADDFSKDNVGDFPKRLEFIKGNMEVAEWKGARWLRATTDGQLEIPLPENLPDRFTVEFDHVGVASSWPHVTLTFAGKKDADRGMDWVVFKTWDGNSETSGGGIFGGDGTERAKGQVKDAQNKPFTARIMVDGRYAKVYMAGTRVANVPNANLGRANKIFLMFDASTDNPAYFGNFRIAAGGKKLYDAIAEKGRVSTQGIYFDTGSDRIRPESAPTLKEIASMLGDHSDLKLTIEGHTDNVGSAASNQTLSEKRAAAVRQLLIDQYSIDGARLTAKGLGATKPVGTNDTPEGRQNNRRVELVKM